MQTPGRATAFKIVVASASETLLPLEVKWSRICAGKKMCFTQDEGCHERSWLLLLWTSVLAVVALSIT